MKNLSGKSFFFLLCLALSSLLMACNTAVPKPTITVASKNFTEQFIVGEMYALLLEDAGFTVNRQLNFGETPVVHAALLEGTVDLYPEYTGTGLLTILKAPVQTNSTAVYQTVSQEYRSQFNLRWLEAAPMNNTQALAMTKARAAELGINTISDMVAQANQLTMAGPPEFREREDGLLGLQDTYGEFELNSYLPIDPGLRYTALVDGEVDVVVAFGTDGQISAFDLLLLEDNRNLWPPYQIAPVVRGELLDANPEIADVLNQLAPLMSDETMQFLNNEVSGNGRSPAAVAREFLLENNLIEE